MEHEVQVDPVKGESDQRRIYEQTEGKRDVQTHGGEQGGWTESRRREVDQRRDGRETMRGGRGSRVLEEEGGGDEGGEAGATSAGRFLPGGGMASHAVRPMHVELPPAAKHHPHISPFPCCLHPPQPPAPPLLQLSLRHEQRAMTIPSPSAPVSACPRQ